MAVNLDWRTLVFLGYIGILGSTVNFDNLTSVKRIAVRILEDIIYIVSHFSVLFISLLSVEVSDDILEIRLLPRKRNECG